MGWESPQHSSPEAGTEPGGWGFPESPAAAELTGPQILKLELSETARGGAEPNQVLKLSNAAGGARGRVRKQLLLKVDTRAFCADCNLAL